jgi:probable HAF family extracellular repeat protein
MWMDGYRHDLGPGIPFATTSRGVVVGSTSFPGIIMSPISGYESDPNGDYPLAVPHAVRWSPDGKQSRLFAGDGRSVAWDINDRGIIVGMMQSADGRHFAFRWHDGRMQLLDKLPHPPGWRFESAYAVDGEGRIAGIGTYHGIATAFLWRPE